MRKIDPYRMITDAQDHTRDAPSFRLKNKCKWRRLQIDIMYVSVGSVAIHVCAQTLPKHSFHSKDHI